MKKMLACLLIITATVVYAQTVTVVVTGTIKKIDAGAKTIVITTADGAPEVLEFSDRTIVHGVAAGATDTFKGLKEGAEVAAHYTVSGVKKTAVEVDNIGKGGLRVIEGTVTKVDAGARIVAVKTADGAETVFDATEAAVADVGKGAVKAGKVTAYYSEEGSKKVVHFFKKL